MIGTFPLQALRAATLAGEGDSGAPPPPFHLFGSLGNVLGGGIDSYIQPAVAHLVAALTPVAITGATLYFVLMGYMIITGAVQESLYTFLKQCGKILLVAAFALNADTYMTSVMGGLRGLEDGLVSALGVVNSAQSYSQSNYSDGIVDASDTFQYGDAAYRVLDQALIRSMNLIATCFEHAGQSGVTGLGAAFGWVFAGCCIVLASLVVIILAGATIFVAKTALSIVFAIGPFFVMSLMWPVTARFFDSWFSQVLNYTLTSVLTSVLMSFALAAFDSFIRTATLDSSAVNPALVGVQVLAVGLVLSFLMLQVASLAAGLAGGMSLSSVGISFLLSPVRAAKGALAAANAPSTRIDAKSGQKVHQSRLAHIADGNTMPNPKYRQAFLDSLGRNWGRAEGGKVKEGRRQ